MVEQVDRAMKTILDALQQRALSENTLVVFLSDNGGNEDNGGALNNPLRGGKGEVFEGGYVLPGLYIGRIPSIQEWKVINSYQ